MYEITVLYFVDYIFLDCTILVLFHYNQFLKLTCITMQYWLGFMAFSLWDFTNVVMNFLCGDNSSNYGSPCTFKWLENFDIVVTGRSAIKHFFKLIIQRKYDKNIWPSSVVINIVLSSTFCSHLQICGIGSTVLTRTCFWLFCKCSHANMFPY